MVVYHGSPTSGFAVFDTRGKGNSYETGAWFTSRRVNAETYEEVEGEGLYAVFLNIRNPYIIEGGGRWWNELSEISIYDNETGEEIYFKDDGMPFVSERDAREYISDVLGYDARNDPNVYPIDENGYKTYTPENERYTINFDDEYSATNQIARAVFNGELAAGDNDGVIFRNIFDTGAASGGTLTAYKSDVFVVPIANNIKSATGNNGNYSQSENSVYRQIVGRKAAEELDRAAGSTYLMDMLKLAKRMEGKQDRAIWLATGWMRGVDGKWRMEIMDGQLTARNKTKPSIFKEYQDLLDKIAV